MNWTAILALCTGLAVLIVQHIALRDANERADQAWARADEYAKRENAALNKAAELALDHVVANAKLEAELVTAKALARRRQSRTGQRAGETDV